MKRIRSRKHIKFVRSLPCAVTGRGPVEAHHIIGHGQGGMGLKACDYFAMPLSPELHRELHNSPGWKAWEQKHGSQWIHVIQTLRRRLGLPMALPDAYLTNDQQELQAMAEDLRQQLIEHMENAA